MRGGKVWVSLGIGYVWFRLLRSGGVLGLSFWLDFFLVLFFNPFCTVFVGKYDFPSQGVPIASCVANFSGVDLECGKKR